MKQNLKWKIPFTVFERQILRLCSYKNRKLKVKLWCVGVPERKRSVFFVPSILFTAYRLLCFISIYSVLHTLSEYTYFYISKNITSYTFLLVLKNVESPFSVSLRKNILLHNIKKHYFILIINQSQSIKT